MSAARGIIAGASVAVLSACATPPIDQGTGALLAGDVVNASSPIADGLVDLRGRSEDFLGGPPLSTIEIAGWAVRRSPALRVARAQAGVGAAQAFSAGLLPDPQLQLSYDHPTNVQAFDALSAGLSLDVITSLINHPNARARMRAEQERIRQELTWTEWSVAMQARDAAIRVIFLRQQAAVAAEATEQTESQLRAYERAVADGDARLDDLAVRRIGFLDALDRLNTIERDLDAAVNELNGFLALGPGETPPLAEVVSTSDPASLDPEALFQQALAVRSDLSALRSSYEANEASLRFARVAALPLPNLSLSRARDTSDVRTSGAGLSLVLPIWNRGRGDIAIARATRVELQAEYDARVFQARADIALQVETLRRVAAQRAILEREVAALSRETEVLRTAAEAGDVPVLTYETARASLLDKRLAALALAAAQAQGEAALDGLVGRLLVERDAS
ncbi:heavy metal RND efflux outer membrane protein of CzcC family [alpha proteobacterium U9-1i]|nr:heavy metal RND efflux outer membrane protein of CzcC family [alpha proteobacterium U9-1i]